MGLKSKILLGLVGLSGYEQYKKDLERKGEDMSIKNAYEFFGKPAVDKIIGTVGGAIEGGKKYFDKNYKEKATNFTGHTKLEIIFGDEYYQTFGDYYKLDPKEDDYMCLYNDYGQLFNGRQFFKKDYNPELTKKHNFY